MSGGVSFSFHKISCRCQGWWHDYSLWKKGRELFTRIRRSNSDGFLWSLSCGCWPVPHLSWCSLLCYSTLSIFSVNKFSHSLLDRFPELRDALEKLQLNDAALKVCQNLCYFSALCCLDMSGTRDVYFLLISFMLIFFGILFFRTWLLIIYPQHVSFWS